VRAQLHERPADFLVVLGRGEDRGARITGQIPIIG